VFLDSLPQCVDATPHFLRVIRAEYLLVHAARVTGMRRWDACWCNATTNQILGTIEEIQEFAHGPPDDGVDIELLVFGHLEHGFTSPLSECCITALVDLIVEVEHVLNEQDVVVQRFLVFGVCTEALACHWCSFRDRLKTIEHGPNDLVVCCINHGARFESLGPVGRRQHVFNDDGEVGEDLYKGNDALALVDLDLGLFNGTKLSIHKLVEGDGKPFVDPTDGTDNELLVGVLQLEAFALECA